MGGAVAAPGGRAAGQWRPPAPSEDCRARGALPLPLPLPLRFLQYLLLLLLLLLSVLGPLPGSTWAAAVSRIWVSGLARPGRAPCTLGATVQQFCLVCSLAILFPP